MIVDEAEKIRKEMARIRRGLPGEIQDIKESARTMTDYRYYLQRHPWACMGAAVAIGYLIVPNRTRIVSPDVETLEQLAKKNKLLVKAQPNMEKQQPGPLNMLFKLAANSLLRAGVAYAGQQLGRAFAEPESPAAERKATIPEEAPTS